MAVAPNPKGPLSTRFPCHQQRHTRAVMSLPSSLHLQRMNDYRHTKQLITCSLSMNGCDCRDPSQAPLAISETHMLPSVPTLQSATAQLSMALAALQAQPPLFSSGIIRLQVPIKERGDAIEWLHAQSQSLSTVLFPRCFFSSRSAINTNLYPSVMNGHRPPYPNPNPNLNTNPHSPVSVAGVGSAVFFRGSDPFSVHHWTSIKRFLSRESPLIRAYGAIRFDARSNVSLEWENYGSFYFIVPQVEFNELEEGSTLAMTIAWDDSLQHTWHTAVDQLQATLHQICPHFTKIKESSLRTNIASLSYVPTKPCWDNSVKKALGMIKGGDSDLVKVVLARCSRYLTDTCIDPVDLLSCLRVEGQNAYQFCIQPPDAPAFVGNSPEQLFHRKNLNISSEALAGTRSRGFTSFEDFHIGQDLLFSPKENIEFTVVRENIQKNLEALCSEVVVEPRKALRKLPRVQHLCAQLSGKLTREDDEFEVLKTLHPSPAVGGLPTEEARRFIEENEMFDRGMYAGPVGWFGGVESEFSVGIRSALIGKGKSTLVYAGAGIVKGTNPSSEWKELDLKASQFTKLLQNKLLSFSKGLQHHESSGHFSVVNVPNFEALVYCLLHN
ncbi:Isochorismate synthase [Rhynchospora pubera]|uniref:isochorismate synthase n=1 Tax=Rhynchospora pubera TaxID=906938 RepID=A0AAV8C1Y2_9POAL|nr:Isochorismate synthase [Rhynchospora pubera]